VILGLVLIGFAVLGWTALAAALLGASPEGAIGLVGLGTVSAPGAAAIAAVLALATTSAFFVGLGLVLEDRRRRARVVREDRLALDAAREARARLLGMRLEQLETEVETLESRRQAVLHRSLSTEGTSWHVADETDGELVVVPEAPSETAS
jgi:hypothetical protein